MADPKISSMPQAFTFRAGSQTLQLKGFLTGYTGTANRRSVTHVFVKRAASREEDMEREAYGIEVRLVFTGPTCAEDYRNYKEAVRKNPVGLLNHPTEGQWTAFCKGVRPTVDLAKATDLIEASSSFIETDVEKTTPVETPTVSTAQQSVTSQIAQYQQVVAEYMGKVAITASTKPGQLQSLNAVMATIALDVTSAAQSPIDIVQATIDSTMGSAPEVIAAMNGIATAADQLTATVNDFVLAADDSFTPDTASTAGLAASLDSSIEGLIDQVGALIDQLDAASPTPAGAADAANETCVLLDACMTLRDAVQASRPPVARYTVKRTGNLIVIAQQILDDFEISGGDAEAYAEAIRQLNKIPNPGEVKAGTQLDIPTR